MSNQPKRAADLAFILVREEVRMDVELGTSMEYLAIFELLWPRDSKKAHGWIWRADSTIREDIAHLSLSFPIESRRGPYGGYHIAQGQRPFAKHVAYLVALSQQLIQMNLVSELQVQLMQEAILALLSISSDISHVHFDSTAMTVNAWTLKWPQKVRQELCGKAIVNSVLDRA